MLNCHLIVPLIWWLLVTAQIFHHWSLTFCTDMGLFFYLIICPDCGAGIGRVSQGLLLPLFSQVDLVEQNQSFLDQAKTYLVCIPTSTCRPPSDLSLILPVCFTLSTTFSPLPFFLLSWTDSYPSPQFHPTPFSTYSFSFTSSWHLILFPLFPSPPLLSSSSLPFRLLPFYLHHLCLSSIFPFSS